MVFLTCPSIHNEEECVNVSRCRLGTQKQCKDNLSCFIGRQRLVTQFGNIKGPMKKSMDGESKLESY
jgi:hypothetical protein